MINKITKAILFYLLMHGLAGCAHSIDNILALDKAHLKQTPTAEESISIVIEMDGNTNISTVMDIEFLGVGGFAFIVNGEKIITAPSYTNPPLWRNIPGVSIASDPVKVEKLFPEYLTDAYDPNDKNVKAIIVGHSHYDHLLDVPHLMKCLIQESKAYGSTTMSAILGEFDLSCESNSEMSRRVFAVDESADKDWVYIDNKTRVFPITSRHPPHVFGITGQTGYYKSREVDDLRTAWDWKMGEVYSYLIDLLSDNGEILYRIYYQDTATALNPGSKLDQVLAGRGVDIAILTMAGSGNSTDKNFPAQLVNKLKAQLYIIGHWEDFFDNDFDSPKVARLTDENQFISNLEGAVATGTQWILPTPGRKMQIIQK